MTRNEMNLIMIASKFEGDLRTGKKTTTVRKGRRTYTLGEGVFKLIPIMDASTDIPIVIESITYMSFGDLTEEIAKTDGFDNLDELKSELLGFYSDLTKEDEVTVVGFSVI